MCVCVCAFVVKHIHVYINGDVYKLIVRSCFLSYFFRARVFIHVMLTCKVDNIKARILTLSKC